MVHSDSRAKLPFVRLRFETTTRGLVEQFLAVENNRTLNVVTFYLGDIFVIVRTLAAKSHRGPYFGRAGSLSHASTEDAMAGYRSTNTYYK